jgi:anti-sigma-K factor RskA
MDHADARHHIVDLVVPGLGDPGRRAALKAHVAVCPECQAQLRDLERVHAGLAAAGPMPDPSPQLRERVLGLVAEGPEPRPAPLPAAVPRPARRGRLWQNAAVWRSTAAALAVAAALLGALVLRDDDADPPSDPWRSDRSVALEPAPGWDVSGSAAFQVGPDDRRAVRVAVAGLRPVDGDWYELWLARSPSDRVSLGRFRPDADGRLWTVVSLPEIDEDGYGGVWLTREPDDGDPRWTRDWVFKARLT